MGFTPAEDAMRILLVDDEPMLLKSLTRYLGGACGHDVICASSGRAALAEFEDADDIDVIFCDLTMPDIDGVGVHRAIHEHHPEWRGRFVFLTGGVIDAAIGSYIRSSGALVLSKPVRQTAFEKVLADVSGV